MKKANSEKSEDVPNVALTKGVASGLRRVAKEVTSFGAKLRA